MIGLWGEVMIFDPDISMLDVEAMRISLLHRVVLVAVALPVIYVLTHCNIYNFYVSLTTLFYEGVSFLT
jgi:hypothetical protein